MARILVTGGAGFIGSNLVHALLKRGDEVVVLDNFSTGRRENLDSVLNEITLVDGSLANLDDVLKALDGVDGVLHQGALPSVPKSLEHPIETNLGQCGGQFNSPRWMSPDGVKQVVYAASSSAYGDHDASVKSEDLEVRPKSPYAVQKLCGEFYASVYSDLFGLRTVALRYFNVFGPRQNPKSQYAAVVPAFVTRMLKGEAPIIFGTGHQSRDFTFIDNVIEANLAALNAPDEACGQTVNIGCGGSITLLDLVDSINGILGTNIEPVFEAARAGDVMHSRADISKAGRLIGYDPKVSIHDGLVETIKWYRRD